MPGVARVPPAAGAVEPDALLLQVGGFSSAHPGGANFTIGDGAVRFISQNVNPATLKNLANRADGELPEDY
jgi:hypothetical protein